MKHYSDNKNLEQLARAQTQEDLCTEENNGFLVAKEQSRPLSTEYGYCVYRDFRRTCSRRCPSGRPPARCRGQSGSYLRMILFTRPSTATVHIKGVYRANLNTHQTHNAILKNFIIAIGVQQTHFEPEKPNLDENYIMNIKTLAKDDKAFKILGSSIASSIEDHLNVKNALLLQLLYDMDKNLETAFT